MEPRPKQRLAVFLDGTWNTQDDSTNVRHAFTLTKEGIIEEKDGPVVQKRYYDPGVGTGMLDSVTGGGFGIGLDANVRQAYNWLVDNYNEGDEIYIFGFSRGAYTARSLMGFIGACGLVKRGAPLMVSQMWNSYVFIAQHRRRSKEWWENALKKHKYNFRRITALKWDDWRGGKQRTEPMNEAEQIVIDWSRRVKITYMGIYDTVGAMGWQALGLPGISSKMEQHHNPYPSKLLNKCRHALAIDENRTSFRLTPMLDYVPNKADAKETEEYNDIIEQNWFVGAHSNVGGGYEDNILATRPLEWILEGANNAGLKTRELSKLSLTGSDRHIRDSYAEFASPLWAHLIRAKRRFRPIARLDEVRSGYSLRQINESVDQSVVDLAEASPDYAPPGLINYAERSDNKKLKNILANREPNPDWPGKSLKARVILIVWCALAAIGFGAFSQLFLGHFPASSWIGFPILAGLFVLIDWTEAWANLKTALQPTAILAKVVRNILLWARLVGMLSFFIGLVGVITIFWKSGWNNPFDFSEIPVLSKMWFQVPLVSAGVVLFLDIFAKSDRVQGLFTTLKAAVIAMFALPVLGAIVIVLISMLEHLIGGFLPATEDLPEAPLSSTSLVAGKILLMQLLLFALYWAFNWVGKPMSRTKANMGSILALQFAFSPSRLKNLFNNYSKRLTRAWWNYKDGELPGWESTKLVLHEALWRDIIGFTPIYTVVFGVIMWIGAYSESPDYWFFLGNNSIIPGIAWWQFIIGITAIADTLENFIHLRHIKNHTNGGSSGLLIATGILSTLIKFVGFIPSFLISMGIFVSLTWEILVEITGGWRWVTASCISYLIILVIVPVLLSYLRMFVGMKKDS